ncbi:MAG: molecular chaperone TorD family protein [bacterium]
MIQGPAGRAMEELAESAAMWQFFLTLFQFPSLKQWMGLREERIRKAWAVLQGELNAGADLEIPVPADVQTYEEQYLSTFEVGIPHPVCPLIESHWNKRYPAPRILHENILFYKQFGLELRPVAAEMADHLRYQLEFLLYLDRLEHHAWEKEGGDELIRQVAQGRRDFLERHPGFWIPAAARDLNGKLPGLWPPFWMNLLALAMERAVERARICTVS